MPEYLYCMANCKNIAISMTQLLFAIPILLLFAKVRLARSAVPSIFVDSGRKIKLSHNGQAITY